MRNSPVIERSTCMWVRWCGDRGRREHGLVAEADSSIRAALITSAVIETTALDEGQMIYYMCGIDDAQIRVVELVKTDSLCAAHLEVCTSNRFSMMSTGACGPTNAVSVWRRKPKMEQELYPGIWAPTRTTWLSWFLIYPKIL